MLRIVIARTDAWGKNPIIGDAIIDDAGQVKWTKASPEATAAVLRLTQANIVSASVSSSIEDPTSKIEQP